MTMIRENEDLPDELHPDSLFSTTHSALLIDIAKGRIDPVALAKRTLANRGIDEKRRWIGFDKAGNYWTHYKSGQKVCPVDEDIK